MVKFSEAMGRLFSNVFVCRKCKSKIRAPVQKIMDKKVKCRRCQGKSFRPIKRAK